MYRSPLPVMDFDLFLITVFAVVHTTASRKGIIVDKNVTVWIPYLVVLICSLLFAGGNASSLVMVVMKNVLCVLFMLFGYMYELLDEDVLIRQYRLAVTISTIYLFIQMFFYYILHQALWGYIPDLVQTQSYSDRVYTILTDRMFRPTSLFYESSSYASFVVIALVIFLFDEERFDLRYSIFVTVGIFASTSGIGIALAAFLWGGFFLRKIMLFKKKFTYSIIVIILFLVAMTFYFRSLMGQLLIYRVFNPNAIGGNAFLGRTGGYKYLSDLKGIHLLFGNGYGASRFISERIGRVEYFGSWPYIIYGTGIIGLVVSAAIFIRNIMFSHSRYINMILLITILNGFVATAFNGENIIFIFSFVLAHRLKLRQKATNVC